MGLRATATGPLPRWGAVAVMAALLLAVLLPPPPALACSCASSTIEETVARTPDAIVAVVQRIDPGGRGDGVGRVLHTIHGTLPDEVPLELDDGASCRPFVPPGSVATLTFVRDGRTLVTVECGRIDDAAGLRAAFGLLEPDPEAAGPPAVALTGGFPGSDLVLLDADLRVLSVSELAEPWTAGFARCGDALVVAASGDVGLRLTRYSLPDLDVTGERTVPGLHEARLSCREDGSVAVAGRLDAPELTGAIVPDVFGDQPVSRDRIEVDDMEWAGVHEDRAYVIRRRGDRAAEVTELDLTTLDTRVIADVPVALYEGWVAPDGRHLAVRGFGEEPLLMTLRTEDGSVAGRSHGWWFPQGATAWLDADRLLLVDENREFGVAGGAHRVVDASLTDVGQVPATQQILGAGAGTLLVGGGGYRVGVTAVDGGTRLSPDLRLVAAHQGILLGEVTGGEPVEASQNEDPTVPRPPGTDERPAWAVIGATVVGALAVAGAGLVGWRRSRREDRSRAPT